MSRFNNDVFFGFDGNAIEWKSTVCFDPESISRLVAERLGEPGGLHPSGGVIAIGKCTITLSYTACPTEFGVVEAVVVLEPTVVSIPVPIRGCAYRSSG
jgi:hypothetical protein